MQMPRRQYDALPRCYRGIVDGNAGTVYGPIQITDSPALPIIQGLAERSGRSRRQYKTEWR